MIRPARRWLLAALLLIWPATAGASEAIAPADAAPLDDVQLDSLRGGLRTPSGVEFGFGAVVRTYVDGALALETQLTWTDQGAVQTQGARAAGEMPANVPGITLPPGAQGWAGVVLPGDGGATAVLHDLDAGAVNNIILNTASNRDIRQETLLTLNIPALDQFQKDALAAQLSMRLSDAVGAALSEAAAH